MKTVSADVLRAQVSSILGAWGMSRAHVAVATHVMVETDLFGIDSHGIGMLPGYRERLEQGRINPKPDIKVVREREAVALIDADRSLGHPPSVQAMSMAIQKAKATGMGVVGVRNSNHFGAAGFYSLMAAREGVVGMAMTGTSSPLMVPTFGREPMFGTNPLAFAAPAKKNDPFHLDMATTTVAFGKINIARRLGKPLPEGWALDEDGQPLTDSQKAFKLRRMTPLGGTRELGSHKGYGLAMMVDILCSTLTGAWVAGIDPATGRRGEVDNVGHFFLAIDPAKLREKGEFEDDMDRLIDMLHGSAPADPEQPVMVAGESEFKAYKQRSKSGVPVSDTLYNEVRAVAEASGVPFLFGN